MFLVIQPFNHNIHCEHNCVPPLSPCHISTNFFHEFLIQFLLQKISCIQCAKFDIACIYFPIGYWSIIVQLDIWILLIVVSLELAVIVSWTAEGMIALVFSLALLTLPLFHLHTLESSFTAVKKSPSMNVVVSNKGYNISGNMFCNGWEVKGCVAQCFWILEVPPFKNRWTHVVVVEIYDIYAVANIYACIDNQYSTSFKNRACTTYNYTYHRHLHNDYLRIQMFPYTKVSITIRLQQV